MGCSHSAFDPDQHDYCPNCGESDTEKVALEIEREHLRALLTRVLAAEGRCPTKLLIDISRALA